MIYDGFKMQYLLIWMLLKLAIFPLQQEVQHASTILIQLIITRLSTLERPSTLVDRPFLTDLKQRNFGRSKANINKCIFKLCCFFLNNPILASFVQTLHVVNDVLKRFYKKNTTLEKMIIGAYQVWYSKLKEQAGWLSGRLLAQGLRFQSLSRHPVVEVSSSITSSSCCFYQHHATGAR